MAVAAVVGFMWNRKGYLEVTTYDDGSFFVQIHGVSNDLLPWVMLSLVVNERFCWLELIGLDISRALFDIVFNLIVHAKPV